MHRDERLRKSERLLRPAEFRRVYDHGERKSYPLFTAFALKTDLKCSRLGITATKRIGQAVIRNRCKRLLREAYRKNKDLVQQSYDVLINVKRALGGADYALIEDQLKRFLSQLTS